MKKVLKKSKFFMKNNCLADLRFIIINDDIEEWVKINNINLLKFTLKNLSKIKEILIKSGQKNLIDFKFKKEIDWDKIFDSSNEENEMEKDFIQSIGLNIFGKPDFIIWNDYEYVFVEYKTINDVIHKNQLEWYIKYKRLPIVIIKSLKKGKYVKYPYGLKRKIKQSLF